MFVRTLYRFSLVQFDEFVVAPSRRKIQVGSLLVLFATLSTISWVLLRNFSYYRLESPVGVQQT